VYIVESSLTLDKSPLFPLILVSPLFEDRNIYVYLDECINEVHEDIQSNEATI